MRFAALVVVLAAAFSPGVVASTIEVCAEATPSCRFVGGGGLQAAIDAAADGDAILVRKGTYVAAGTRDVPFQKYTIRGGWMIDGKRLSIAGEDGVVLDGGTGPFASGIVVRGGEVGLRNLVLRGFRWEVQEDDIYDGHGVFVIDASVRLAHLRFERIAKMGITARGDATIVADDIVMRDGHVGIWLEESAQLRLRNARIVGNDSAALTAYGQSSATASHCLFEDNRDDGVYAAGDATIYLRDSVVTANKPFGLNTKDRGRIRIAHSVLAGNKKSFPGKGDAVRLGPGMLRTLDARDGSIGPRVPAW